MSTQTKDSNPSIGFNLHDFNSTTILTEKGKGIEDEYDPFEHRDEHGNSTMGSLVHLLKSSLGSGILAMPMAFRNSGLLFGAIGTLVVGFICTHCVHILVKTSHGVCRRVKEPALGFAETAEKAFETGPPSTRRFAKFAKTFCDYGMVLTYLGASCVYMVLIAKSFHDVINYVLEHNFNTPIDLDVRFYIAAVCVPCILLGEIRQLKYLVPFSAIANLCIVLTFAITLYYMFNEPLKISDKPLFSSWGQLPMFFSTVIFAMEGIGVVMPVENSMRRPQSFLGCPGVLNTAMITVMVLYAVIGFFGYVRYGDEVQGSITLNLPEGVIYAQVAQISIGVAILFTFGLQFYVPMDIIWRRLGPSIPKDKHNISQILLRAGIILIMGGVAAAVPKLEPFIGLVGSVFFSILGLMVPAVVETVYKSPNFGFCNWILVKNIILIILAILALITGSFLSIGEIIEMYTSGH